MAADTSVAGCLPLPFDFSVLEKGEVLLDEGVAWALLGRGSASTRFGGVTMLEEAFLLSDGRTVAVLRSNSDCLLVLDLPARLVTGFFAVGTAVGKGQTKMILSPHAICPPEDGD